MMSEASWRLDDGLSCATNCFPARTFLSRNREGAGHWLVAYRKAQEQKSRVKETCENSSDSVTAGHRLDGSLLLRLHRVDAPSDLCSVDVSEQNLTSAKPEDLRMFDNVAYVDACINSLSLGSFSSFISLREINLSLNGIRNMTFEAANFPHLEVLNLSYNYSSADDIVSIGRLTRLKVLHLTGNQLHHLPPDLGSSSRDTPPLQTKEGDEQFGALEVLMLDDNKLTSGVFSSLRNLKRLKYLNLQGNHISEVPYLQLMDCSDSAQISVKEQDKEKGLAHTQANPDTSEKENCEGNPVFRASFPLPELQSLNLAENKIAEEGALMAVALFPKLREIDIHSNPLTTKRSGDPPLLTYYLRERLGITIHRKKAPDVAALPLKMSSDPKWKVEDKIPHVSEKRLMDAPTQAEEREETVQTAAQAEGKKKRDGALPEHTEHFFVTQAADFSEYDKTQTAINKEREEDRENLNSYKMLTDTKLNPDAMQPIGIQTAVRMLEHTLKNLNVYRDSRPKLDSIQTPYREKDRRIKDLPPLKPTKQKAERLHGMMKGIRTSTVKREVTLSSVIHDPGANKQAYNEAVSLLRDMKAKYRMVRKKTMEQAANVEPNEAEPQPVRRSRP